MRSTVQIVIRGKVQGVWFRKHVKSKARELGITGFAQNKPDGSVYVIAQGENQMIEELLDFCWQGSPLSKVESVQNSALPTEKNYLDFGIL